MSTPARAPTVLDRILAETRQEVARRKREAPEPATPLGAPGEAALERAPTTKRPGARPFRDALLAPGIAVIAEFKRRSPSAGALGRDPDLAQIVGAYARAGAAAVSVLTEGPNFGGALSDLRLARAACGLPLLRKDFIVDPYQLHEARDAGADAVLLIVAALAPEELTSLHECSRALGLDALVEVHDEQELDSALAAGAEIVGINNRDLRDFSVDVARTERLLGAIPAGVIVVSESGIAGSAQVRRLHDQGVGAVLVGESLMRAEDPEAALRSLLGA